MVTSEEKLRVRQIIRLLKQTYPTKPLTLEARTPLEYLIATMLSAQSTDVQVNRVTTVLFQKYRTPEDYVHANSIQLQQDIHSVGYYRQKTKHIQATCQMLIEEYNGEVPRTMDELVKLPGVGRKTANIVLNRAFGIVEGIAVDTHVFRLAQRLGMSDSRTPTQVEKDLMAVLNQQLWGQVNRLFIAHGRALCKARKPLCNQCPLNPLCPYPAIYKVAN